MRRFIVYLIGPEPDGVHLASNERSRLIHESDLCMHSERFFLPGDRFTVDEQTAETCRSVKTDRGGIGIAFGTVLQAVEVRANGKQVLFEEVSTE